MMTVDGHLKTIDFGTALFFDNKKVPKELL